MGRYEKVVAYIRLITSTIGRKWNVAKISSSMSYLINKYDITSSHLCNFKHFTY